VKKDLSYYLKLDYPITITKDIDKGEVYFEAEIPDLPGCGAHGKTIDEAINNLEEAKKLWMEVSLEKGLDIPEPVTEEEFSGKFLLRIPPKLHMKLSQNAKREGISLNQYVRNTIEKNVTLESLEKEVKEVKAELSKLIRGEIMVGPGAEVTYPEIDYAYDNTFVSVPSNLEWGYKMGSWVKKNTEYRLGR